MYKELKYVAFEIVTLRCTVPSCCSFAHIYMDIVLPYMSIFFFFKHLFLNIFRITPGLPNVTEWRTRIIIYIYDTHFLIIHIYIDRLPDFLVP